MRICGREYRLVDLSLKLEPGKEKRRLEIRRFRYEYGEFMHDIDTMSHIGTHVECPSHYVDARWSDRHGADISEVPLETFIGEAVFVDLSGKGPREAITPGDLEVAGIKKGDIVLMGNSHFTGEDRPYLSPEAAKWLAEKGVKMVGFDDSVSVEAPRVKTLKDMATHENLLCNGIPIIEGLVNLKGLKKRRFIFIGLPVAIKGLDSFPIRAIALEPAE